MAIATKPKPKAHTKKRQAQHHKRSQHYLKPYWPYLPMLAIMALGFVINNALSQPAVLGATSNYSSNVLLQATNNNRSSDHETALTLNAQLSQAAQAKAEDMVKNNYWAHNSPSGKTPWTFITGSGYQYQAAGENLAYGFGDATAVVAGWMNSPEHRDNILNANYADVGFGVAQAPDFQGKGPQTIVVAEYGQPVDAVAHITFAVPNQGDVKAASDVHDSEISSKPISRVAVMTGGAAWSMVAVSALAGAALALFITRHTLRLHRVLVKGERFISHHPLLDIAIVFIFTAGFVLSRTGGIIR